MEKTETITIRGILIPTAWNDRGDVVAVAIATYNEEKYLVSNDEMVPNLLSLLRKRVVVNGIVNRQNSDRIVDIKDIKVDTFKAKGKKEKANE